jgi:hypothetical protein
MRNKTYDAFAHFAPYIALCIALAALSTRPAQADDRSTDRIVRALEKIASSLEKCR